MLTDPLLNEKMALSSQKMPSVIPLPVLIVMSAVEPSLECMSAVPSAPPYNRESESTSAVHVLKEKVSGGVQDGSSASNSSMSFAVDQPFGTGLFRRAEESLNMSVRVHMLQ